jgi:hypothetical protein
VRANSKIEDPMSISMEMNDLAIFRLLAVAA